MTVLEFTYRIRGRIVLGVEVLFAICITVVLILDGKSSLIWQDIGAWALLVPVTMIGLPVQWLLMKHCVLQLTDLDLQVPSLLGSIVVPLREIDKINCVKHGWLRALEVHTATRKAIVFEMMLPDKAAFGAVYEGLLARRSSK
jgi:hypothetical protein